MLSWSGVRRTEQLGVTFTHTHPIETNTLPHSRDMSQPPPPIPQPSPHQVFITYRQQRMVRQRVLLEQITKNLERSASDFPFVRRTMAEPSLPPCLATHLDMSSIKPYLGVILDEPMNRRTECVLTYPGVIMTDQEYNMLEFIIPTACECKDLAKLFPPGNPWRRKKYTFVGWPNEPGPSVMSCSAADVSVLANVRLWQSAADEVNRVQPDGRILLLDHFVFFAALETGRRFSVPAGTELFSPPYSEGFLQNQPASCDHCFRKFDKKQNMVKCSTRGCFLEYHKSGCIPAMYTDAPTFLCPYHAWEQQQIRPPPNLLVQTSAVPGAPASTTQRNVIFLLRLLNTLENTKHLSKQHPCIFLSTRDASEAVQLNNEFQVQGRAPISVETHNGVVWLAFLRMDEHQSSQLIAMGQDPQNLPRHDHMPFHNTLSIDIDREQQIQDLIKAEEDLDDRSQLCARQMYHFARMCMGITRRNNDVVWIEAERDALIDRLSSADYFGCIRRFLRDLASTDRAPYHNTRWVGKSCSTLREGVWTFLFSRALPEHDVEHHPTEARFEPCAPPALGQLPMSWDGSASSSSGRVVNLTHTFRFTDASVIHKVALEAGHSYMRSRKQRLQARCNQLSRQVKTTRSGEQERKLQQAKEQLQQLELHHGVLLEQHTDECVQELNKRIA